MRSRSATASPAGVAGSGLRPASAGEREAEIKAENAFDIEKQLHRQRLVETEFLAQLGQENLIACTGFARHHQRRIARRHPDEEEVQNDERKKDDDGLRDPLGDEGNHVLSIALEVRYRGVRLGD